MSEFEGKVAIVTGASSGIGRMSALFYAREGAKVVVSDINSEAASSLVALHPIGRLGLPEEVAELVVWLSSKRSSFVNGAYYAVDGGYLAR